MNFELSAREKELSARAREFCDQVLVPLEIITDEHGELPMDRREAVKQAVRDWGFAGINHSKDDGGLGLTMVEQTAIEEQLGR
ncbi:MAG: acyl-CoA dehydrogenase, partial [Proteobacteria bacterium]